MVSGPQTSIPREILEEAAAWFVDFRAGEVDVPAREGFNCWIRKSPQHIQAYLDIAQTYADLGTLKHPGSRQVSDLLARGRETITCHVAPLRVEDPLRIVRHEAHRGPLAMVASICAASAIFIGICTMLALQIQEVYSTEIGAQRSVTLPDGSVVDLDAHSCIRVRFTRSEREVDLLQGRALFTDVPSRTRPFIVRSRDIVIRAIGTKFDVNQEVTGTVVTVIDGRVAILTSGQAGEGPRALTGAAESTPLNAGEQLSIRPGRTLELRRTDAATAIAWRHRQLIFDGTLLADVVNEMNRYTRQPLVLESPALAEMKISGVYTSMNPGSFIRFLREQRGISVTEAHGHIDIGQSSPE